MLQPGFNARQQERTQSPSYDCNVLCSSKVFGVVYHKHQQDDMPALAPRHVTVACAGMWVAPNLDRRALNSKA